MVLPIPSHSGPPSARHGRSEPPAKLPAHLPRPTRARFLLYGTDTKGHPSLETQELRPRFPAWSLPRVTSQGRSSRWASGGLRAGAVSLYLPPAWHEAEALSHTRRWWQNECHTLRSKP